MDGTAPSASLGYQPRSSLSCGTGSKAPAQHRPTTNALGPSQLAAAPHHGDGRSESKGGHVCSQHCSQTWVT
eukprot:9483757-Pyramimonas_sp.AAC.1